MKFIAELTDDENSDVDELDSPPATGTTKPTPLAVA